jgi:hypothetical protein
MITFQCLDGMLMMSQVTNKPALTQWGTRTIGINLPTGVVYLTGLSDLQADRLVEQNYAGYTISPNNVNDGIDLYYCNVYRSPPGHRWPSLDQVTNNGQYTPQVVRQQHGIEVNGINFSAFININDSDDLTSLTIADETALFSPAVIENFLRYHTAHRALEKGGLVLHSAGLVIESNSSVLFMGYSGQGKTTLTRKAFASGSHVLSDDLNVVLPTQANSAVFSAYRAPFTGEFGRLPSTSLETSYPLRSLVLLEHGSELCVEKVDTSTAFAKLIGCSPFINNGADTLPHLFDNAEKIISSVPTYRLTSRRDDEYSMILRALNKAQTHAQSR